MTVDVRQFLQNIEGLGCIPVESFSKDGESASIYLSRNGNHKVFISTTDDEMLIEDAKGLCWDLELGDMISAILPSS